MDLPLELSLKIRYSIKVDLKSGKYRMTRKLESLFGFDEVEQQTQPSAPITVEETQSAMVEIDRTIDKIDAALPTVYGLDSSDTDLDDLASKAQETFDDLMNLGMNVDSRYASEIFAVAGTMLGHALTAKTAKLNKKLKMVDLQLKKLKIDQDRGEDPTVETAHGVVLNNLSRNDLLERLIGNRDQKN
jgi:hypothetical protein